MWHLKWLAKGVSQNALRSTLLAALLMLSVASSAWGAEGANHPFETNFPLNGLNGHEAPFEGACGVALDTQGDVYVSDYYRRVVEVYRSNPDPKKPLAKITKIDPNDGPCGLAVDETGHVYVNDYHHGVLRF